jgi:diacylglycerol kinase (ATP)
LLIVNPGARRAGRARQHVVRVCAEHGVHCDDIVTEAPGHATVIARERGKAGGYDVVFTLGGDGTAMEVITALADDGPPVGILPGGTGNLLVRSLGIPLRVERAVASLLEGIEARIDLGRLPDGRHFAIGLGVGLDERMIAGASPLMKKRVGMLAYVWSAVKAGVKPSRFHARVTVDGVVHEREVTSVLIANLGSVLGGMIKFGGDVLHDDGLLQIYLYSPRSFLETSRIVARMLHGTAHLDPRVLCVAGRTFRIETNPPRRAQADGELLEMTPVDVVVRPNAGRLLIPRGRRSS